MGTPAVWVEPYTTNPVRAAGSRGGCPGATPCPSRAWSCSRAHIRRRRRSRQAWRRRACRRRPPGTRASAPGSTPRRTRTCALPPLRVHVTPVGSVGIPLPVGGRELIPSERLGLVGMPPVYVSGAFTNVTLGFAVQWRVNVTSSPANGGTVRPLVDWWNDSQPLHLTVVNQTPGYAFVGWSGWGRAASMVRVHGRSPSPPWAECSRRHGSSWVTEVDLIEARVAPGAQNWTVTLHTGSRRPTNSHTLLGLRTVRKSKVRP